MNDNQGLLDKLSRITHIVLDMDGTIYTDDRLFDCTLPFFALLHMLGILHTFVTNPDFVCPTDQQTVLVDCGSICGMLETAHFTGSSLGCP